MHWAVFSSSSLSPQGQGPSPLWNFLEKEPTSPLSLLPPNSYSLLTKQHYFIHYCENYCNHPVERTPCPLFRLSWNQPNNAGSNKFCSLVTTGAGGVFHYISLWLVLTHISRILTCAHHTSHDLICSSKLARPHLITAEATYYSNGSLLPSICHQQYA